jgi:Na+/proline symporter
MGLYWKRASSGGALLSMVAGIVTWIIFELFETGWPSLVPGTMASFVGMVTGSYVWPKDKKEV